MRNDVRAVAGIDYVVTRDPLTDPVRSPRFGVRGRPSVPIPTARAMRASQTLRQAASAYSRRAPSEAPAAHICGSGPDRRASSKAVSALLIRSVHVLAHVS